MKLAWWKILSIACLIYAVVGGMLLPVPARPIVNESIRNLYYHVPMWFGMMVLMTVSVIYAMLYLRHSRLEYDIQSRWFGGTGMLMGLLGIITGAIWANYTWGAPWSNDIKQILAATALLIYAAYFVLRSSIDDIDKKARISAVYNIFAFAAMIPLIFIIPRMTDSMHPGNGGNPGFNMYDLDSRMRPIFYAANIGWIAIGAWIATMRIRTKKIEETIYNLEDEKLI